MAIEAGVAIYASHTNLDRAAGGVNDALCGEAGLAGAAQAQPGSIARVATLEKETSLDAFAQHVKAALEAPHIRVTGDGCRLIRKVYVVSGAGRHDIGEAAQYGSDCLLTGEIGYHDGFDAAGLNLCVVEAGHYHTERPVLKQIEKHLQSEFQRLQYTVRTAVYKKSTCPFYHIG
jgi:putative NIF3 family GTP cyclohydrolase 1 type 2